MKYLKIAALFISVFAVNGIYAQKSLRLNLDYSYGIPLGGLKNDIISNGSARGFGGDLMYQINNQWGAGFSVGFQDFYQKYPRALYKTGDNETTSAVLSNSVQVMPILLKGQYNFAKKPSRIQPYISLGAGLGLVDFTQYLGEFAGQDNAGSFMVQGGAGVAVPFSKTGLSGLRIGGDYNFISYKQNGFGNLESVSLKAGLYFPLQ